MGWWWKSDPQTPVLHPSDPTPDPQPSPSEPPSSPPEITDKPTKVLSREEQADAELTSLIAAISSSSPSSSQHVTRHDPISDAAVASTTTSQPPQLNSPSSTSADDDLTAYPTTMSCRAAFDSAFYCQSLGGQFNSVYRYGHLRSCSPLWSDFWFCMRIKSYPEDEKREMIRQRYREKEEVVRSGRNSEDVWERRTRRERVERAFHLDPDTGEIVEGVRQTS